MLLSVEDIGSMQNSLILGVEVIVCVQLIVLFIASILLEVI